VTCVGGRSSSDVILMLGEGSRVAQDRHAHHHHRHYHDGSHCQGRVQRRIAPCKHTRRLATARRSRVNVRVAELLARARGGVDHVIIYLSYNLITVQNLVGFSHGVRACRGPKMGMLGLATPPCDWGNGCPLEIVLPCRNWSF